MEDTKKVTLELVGIDGNAFSIMGAFNRQAREEGWTKEEIKVVLDKAMSGDYDNLLVTISSHCKGPDEEEEPEEFEDDRM